MIKLNIGSNAVIFEGWINIDKYPSQGVELVHDASTRFPHDNNSIDFIFSEHFIEHLNETEIDFYFKECYRMLKPGGIVRTSTFDIVELMEVCIDWENRKSTYLSGRFMDKSRIEFFNLAVYEGNIHKHMFNNDELIRFLKEAGFNQFNQPKRTESIYPELQNLEWRENSDCIIEAIK